MSAQITELTFLEHLAPRFNLLVPEHLTAEANREEFDALLITDRVERLRALAGPLLVHLHLPIVPLRQRIDVWIVPWPMQSVLIQLKHIILTSL